MYLRTGDTTGQAIPLDQVHHIALGPRLPNTDKPRHLLARHGTHDPRRVDPNAPGPHWALLHLTMKHTAQLPATLAGEKYCHPAGSQHPGGHHGRMGRCRGPPHGT